MSITCTEENRCLTVHIQGELDHHRARELMAQLDREVNCALPRKLELDLSGLTFTDSSGIALLLRTYRNVQEIGGTMCVRNTPQQARKVFWAAGLQHIIPFEGV